MRIVISYVDAALRVTAAIALVLCLTLAAHAESDDDDDVASKPITELVVTARRLDAARANIDASLGASTYTLSGEMVDNRPGSESTNINRVLLQAPGVVQDGSGQLRVRQSHGDLQYRINGVILPEGLSDLGESLSARIAQRVQLITGALPAQFGFQAGGVVSITTKNGAYLNGGQIEIYAGGRGEYEPAFEYGTNVGPTNVFVSGSFHRNHAALASPDGLAQPNHDHGDQIDGFAFVDHILNPETRISLILGTSDDRFQIPNVPAQKFLDDRRREATRYAVASLMHSDDPFTLQAAAHFRRSLLSERAEGIQDLELKGLARRADATDDAGGFQLEGVYDLAAAHTLRGGVVASWTRRNTRSKSLVYPSDSFGRPVSTNAIAMRDDTRLSGRKASVFTQDEWRPVAHVTLNFGLRYDDVQSVRRESRVSPRFNGVLSLADGVTLHAGYARYFLPAPLEDESDTPKAFAGTTAAPPTLRGEPLRAETDDYYDVGVEWKDDDLTLGLDGYWRSAKNFIAEGQFGPANLTASFNYSSARVRGIELTATYAEGPFTAWANLAVSQGRGRGIASNQFYFTAGELAAIAGRLTPLGQDQTYSASGGASYRWNGFRFIADAIYGSGLPFTRLGETPNAGHLGGYVQVNLAVRYTVSTGFNRPLDLRFDIINAFDSRYRLRDGSGLGDGPPQWGPRRGFFFGVEQSF